MKASRLISGLTAAAMLASSMPVLSIANAVSPLPDIRINEVCSQNKACLTDSYGESADWIELYNASDEDVSLAGCSISKDPDKPKTWVFPDDAVIRSGEYLVLIASKNESVEGEYHLDFNLSKSGEILTLSAPDGSVIHELEVPTLGEDVTYGITYTGAYEIMEPTPGELNAIAVSAPIFSVPSGFYDENTKLSLSAYEGDTIYYTTDGSDPLTSPTAMVYEDSILVHDRSSEPNIYRAYGEKRGDPQSICAGMNYEAPTALVDKAMVVRAAAKNSDGAFSSVVQQTYFVTDGVLEDYSDATVVSLVTDPDNLFDPDTGIYVIGRKWDWNNNPWSVDTGENIRNFHGKGKAWERKANITVFDSGENIIEQNVGIRIKGSSTRNSILKNFNLFARSEYGAAKINYPIFPDNTDVNGDPITEYDSVSLRCCNIHDTITHKLLEDREDLTMAKKRSCILFINGEYWGLYEFTEKFSDEFIKQHYGVSKSQVAMVKNGQLEEGEEADNNEFHDLVRKYAALDLSKDANYKEACEYFDVDSLIEHYAAGIYYGTWDWPDYNYGVWKDKTEGADNRWHFMSYDFDYTLGNTYEDIITPLYRYNFFEKVEGNGGFVPTMLFMSMLDNKDFRVKFGKVFKQYADKKDAVSIAKSIGESNLAEMTKTKYFTWSAVTSETTDDPVLGMKMTENDIRTEQLDPVYTFLNKRYIYAMQQMYDYLGLTEEDLIEPEEPSIEPSTEPATTTTEAVTTTAATSSETTTTETKTTAAEAETTTTAPVTSEIVTTTVPEPVTEPYRAADLVKFARFLIDRGELDEPDRYDLCTDDRLDVYDMCVLRQCVIRDGSKG